MNNFDNLRDNYILSVPNPDLETQWGKIKPKLGPQNHPQPKVIKYLLLLLIGVLGLSLSIGGAAQAAKPGDNLYSVRLLTDNILTKVTDNPSLIIEKRADDILKVSGDPKRLDDAIDHYQQAVKETERQVQKPEEKQDLKQVLEEQQQKFKLEAKENPSISHKLQIIIEDPKNNGEVKGAQNKKGIIKQNLKLKTNKDR